MSLDQFQVALVVLVKVPSMLAVFSLWEVVGAHPVNATAARRARINLVM